MTIAEKLLLKFKFNVLARLRVNSYPSYNLSHSQFGEDMVARSLTCDSTVGFYIDIGAHHPVYYSNTYHFYSKGWRGINIDAVPGSMEAFRVLRPEDTNLEICLSPKLGTEADFFMFDNGAFNTLDSETARKTAEQNKARLREKVKLPTKTLTECLELYVPGGKSIDLLSIDVEGLDVAILMSTDWSRYKPSILIYEDHDVQMDCLTQSSLFRYLSSFGYEAVGKCGPSVILRAPHRD